MDVVRSRLGIPQAIRFVHDREPETLDVLSQRLGLTRERVRQVQNEALFKLKRHLARRGARPRARDPGRAEPAPGPDARTRAPGAERGPVQAVLTLVQRLHAARDLRWTLQAPGPVWWIGSPADLRCGGCRTPGPDPGAAAARGEGSALDPAGARAGVVDRFAGRSLGSQLGSSLGSSGLGAGVAANLGRAASVGSLSVPQAWAAANQAVTPAARALPLTSLTSAAQTAPGHMLGGLPLGHVTLAETIG